MGGEKYFVRLVDKFLRFEISSQIEHLPSGQAQQTAHTEYAEKQNAIVCRFCNEVKKKNKFKLKSKRR